MASCRPEARGLTQLLDSTGIAQHAIHTVVDRAHGYCLDDNARGLMLATLLPRGVMAARTPLARSCSRAPLPSSSMPGMARRGGFAIS